MTCSPGVRIHVASAITQKLFGFYLKSLARRCYIAGPKLSQVSELFEDPPMELLVHLSWFHPLVLCFFFTE